MQNYKTKIKEFKNVIEQLVEERNQLQRDSLSQRDQILALQTKTGDLNLKIREL